MKAALLLLLVGWTTWTCSPATEPLPVETWTDACAELTPFQGVYRLQLECCSYILLPSINVRNRSFSQAGTYYVFTGAGYANSPVRVDGQLSANGATLTVSYLVNARSISRTLQAGTQHAAACQCVCD